MNYCTRCGGALAEAWVERERRERLVCQTCGEINYLNPKVVAATLPIIDGRVLLVRRAIEPARGAWSYPAGYMEMGETVEEAACRETREEACLEVRLQRILNVYSFVDSGVVVVAYLAERLAGDPGVGDEVLEVGLFLPEDIPWAELAFPSTVAALRDWVGLVRPALARLPDARLP